MNKMEWVFSPLEKGWVQNIVCDVLVDSPEVPLDKSQQKHNNYHRFY